LAVDVRSDQAKSNVRWKNAHDDTAVTALVNVLRMIGRG
jgi:hypothetical protein